MRKRTVFTVETTRPKPLSTLITSPRRMLEQDKYGATDSIIGTPTEDASSVPAVVTVDPTAPPTTEQIPVGTTIYERLTLSAGQYCPTLPASFYRRVWFDGLEAFQLVHFTVDPSNGCVIPESSLPAPIIVTASYVKGY